MWLTSRLPSGSGTALLAFPPTAAVDVDVDVGREPVPLSPVLNSEVVPPVVAEIADVPPDGEEPGLGLLPVPESSLEQATSGMPIAKMQ